jgi:DNA-3-methyladenine glycosylase
MRLKADFFGASTLMIAKRLLGKKLVRQLPEGLVAGWIVETEAYQWRGDPACHASRGITASNRAMFGPPGTLYVYPIHAKFCLNIVTEREGRGAAVLIRAIEPTDGLRILSQYRQGVEPTQWTNGPGKLCLAMSIDRRLNGIDLTENSEIWVESPEALPRQSWKMNSSGRIGISAGQDKPWRFFIDGNRYVSGRASDHSQARRNRLSISSEMDA